MENTFKSICGGGVRMRIQSKVLWGYAEYGPQGPEEMCLSLEHVEHQNPSKTSEKMVYFDRVTVSLHIL